MTSKEKVKNNSLLTTLINVRSSELFWIITFSILTALSNPVAVPTQPVPFTLQTMLVLLSGAFLGSRKSAYSQILYLAVGVIGLPVFARIHIWICKIIWTNSEDIFFHFRSQLFSRIYFRREDEFFFNLIIIHSRTTFNSSCRGIVSFCIYGRRFL